MTALTCPHCSQIDQVGKVSAIVSAGTQSGTQHSVGRSAGYALLGHHNGGPIATVSRTQTHSTTQSVLAQRLSLAPQPAYATATDPIMAPGLGAVAFFVLALLSSAAN